MKLGHTFIAVIDGDSSLCRSLSRLLRIAKFVPVSFHSAEEYLSEPARAFFSCLLVDIQLGGMSGIDLQRRLTSEGTQAAIIFITAADDPEARDEAIRQGCAGFFHKMDDGAKIIECVRAAIGARESRN